MFWANANWSAAFESAMTTVSDRGGIDGVTDRNITVGLTSTTVSTTTAAMGPPTDDQLQPLFSQYPDELLHFAVGACVLFTLLGVPGNFITIVALLRYTKVSQP